MVIPTLPSFPMTACEILRRHQHPAPASTLCMSTISRRMPVRISGIATSLLLSTCRWAWSDSSMYVRGRIGSWRAAVSTRHFSRNRAICAWHADDLAMAQNPLVTSIPDIPVPATPYLQLQITGPRRSCSTQTGATNKMFAYNDERRDDPRYDNRVSCASRSTGFDPNFHFVGMTFNPGEGFTDMKDKYFPAERAQLSRHSHPRSFGHADGRRQHAFLAAAAFVIIHITGSLQKGTPFASRGRWTLRNTRRWPPWEFR